MAEEDAQREAEAQLEVISALMLRYQHAQDCQDIDECEAGKEDILAGLMEPHQEKPLSEEQLLVYHDLDSVREDILEFPLEISVRSGWTSLSTVLESGLDPDEYYLLLCTGGPAVRIRGDLGMYDTPETAVLEYCHWTCGWTILSVTHAQSEDLLEFASMFYYGGDGG